MGVKVVAIEVDTTSPRPVFRITSTDGPAHILMLGVSHADLQEPAWEIATADCAGRSTYSATTQIMLEPEQVLMPCERGSELEGEHWDCLAPVEDNREVSSVTYGELPAGFLQMYPEHGPPAVLDPGGRYKVAVMGACLGEAVFIA